MCLLSLLIGARVQGGLTHIVRRISEVKFSQDSDVQCLMFATETGDPNAGASTHILELSNGCVVPWHYHSAEEQLMVIQGQILVAVDTDTPVSLGPGGFAVMPSKEHHEFSCESYRGCKVFVGFDGAYDICWVKEK